MNYKEFIKTDDHALDELRYYLMSKPEKIPPKKDKTAIEKDKERLMKKLRRNKFS